MCTNIRTVEEHEYQRGGKKTYADKQSGGHTPCARAEPRQCTLRFHRNLITTWRGHL